MSENANTISPRAVLLIAGSKADTLFWSEQAYQAEFFSRHLGRNRGPQVTQEIWE